MARLKLSLLGSFQVLLDGEILDTFAYNKVRALLAYLAADSQHPQRRETLAELLWPGWPQTSALRNFSSALSNLRKTIHDREARPPFLLISCDSLQLDREGDVWVDAWEFNEKARNPNADIDALKSAAGLYHGTFLDGFSLPDSAPFELWLEMQREIYRRWILHILNELEIHHENQQEYEQALLYSHRQLELEPWLEEAHQGVMRLLALSGQRKAALVQYEVCREALKDSLDVEPGAEINALYEKIRNGRLEAIETGEMKGEERTHQPPPSIPSAHPSRTDNLPAPSASLVGRQTELGRQR